MNRIEKEIEFLTEVMRLIAFVLVATTGGIVSLLYKLNKPITLPLIGLGAWLDISLLIGLAIIVWEDRVTGFVWLVVIFLAIITTLMVYILVKPALEK